MKDSERKLLSQIDDLQKEGGAFDEIIFVTPDGKRFDQKDANTLSLKTTISETSWLFLI